MTGFEDIYNKYFKDVYLFIYKLSGDKHIAEDIMSETFMKAIKSIDSFKGNCDIRVWLFQIAKNSYFSHLRKTNRFVEIDVLAGKIVIFLYLIIHFPFKDNFKICRFTMPIVFYRKNLY